MVPSEEHTYIPDMSDHTDTIAPGHAYKYIRGLSGKYAAILNISRTGIMALM